MVASTLGIVKTDALPQRKPRVPFESYALSERYDADAVAAGVSAYDETLRAWWDEQGLTNLGTYSEDVAKTYSRVYFPTVAATFRSQGFEFADEA